MIGILFLSLFSCAVARFGMWMLVGVKLGTQVVWNLKLYFSEEHPLTLFVCISNEWRHSTNLVRAKTWTSACGKLSGEAASLCELGYSGKVPKICIYTGFWQWCNVCLLFKPFLWGKVVPGSSPPEQSNSWSICPSAWWPPSLSGLTFKTGMSCPVQLSWMEGVVSLFVDKGQWWC